MINVTTYIPTSKQSTVYIIAQEIYLVYHMKNMAAAIYFDRHCRPHLHLITACNNYTKKPLNS